MSSAIHLPEQLLVGQRLIYVSSGLAERSTSEMIMGLSGSNAVVIQMSPYMDALELKAIARSAHEVWILTSEAADNPALAMLLEFRRHSIPVSAGERRSVLHAPELGIVRLFNSTQNGELTPNGVLLSLGDSEETLIAAWERMRIFGKRLVSTRNSSTPPNPFAVAPIPGLTTNTLERLRAEILQSAKRDEQIVRWVLASLFALTVVGVVLLQAMAMVGWSVPMADIYAVFFMLVGSSYMGVRKYHLNDRQLLYRLVAQTIEVHLLWHRAGLNEPVTAHFQLRHHASLKWIRELLRITLLTERSKDNSPSSKSVLMGWLPSAISGNQALANWHASRDRRMTWAVYFCYGLSGLLTLGTLLGQPTGWPDVAVGTALGIASSIGTLFLIFGGTLGYSANAALYRHLAELLERTQQSLELDLPDHEYDELLIDTGRECIQAAVERSFQ